MAVGGVGGAGGGNPTLTSLTNPPITKACFSALLDSDPCRTRPRPPGPKKPAVYNFPIPTLNVALLQKGKRVMLEEFKEMEGYYMRDGGRKEGGEREAVRL